MSKCIMCENTIQTEYFEGVSGHICKKCLKEMFVYYALRSMNLLKTERK